MRADWLRISILLAGVLLAVQAVAAEKKSTRVYRWTDDQGVVHFGDRVPPRYSREDREVLNENGVPVRHEEGERTAAERDAEAARQAAAAADAERRAREEARDEILLDTYLSVDEIEALRNQRTELIDAQIRLTEKYLESLRVKLKKLQKDASHFRPYSDDPNAPPMNRNLAKELSDTLDSIILYEQNLAAAKQRKTDVVAKFAADINRFKYLKGLE